MHIKLSHVDRYYANFVTFFTKEVEELGVGKTLEQYIFSSAVNDNGTDMLLRFIGGVWVYDSTLMCR